MHTSKYSLSCTLQLSDILFVTIFHIFYPYTGGHVYTDSLRSYDNLCVGWVYQEHPDTDWGRLSCLRCDWQCFKTSFAFWVCVCFFLILCSEILLCIFYLRISRCHLTAIYTDQYVLSFSALWLNTPIFRTSLTFFFPFTITMITNADCHIFSLTLQLPFCSYVKSRLQWALHLRWFPITLYTIRSPKRRSVKFLAPSVPWNILFCLMTFSAAFCDSVQHHMCREEISQEYFLLALYNVWNEGLLFCIIAFGAVPYHFVVSSNTKEDVSKQSFLNVLCTRWIDDIQFCRIFDLPNHIRLCPITMYTALWLKKTSIWVQTFNLGANPQSGYKPSLHALCSDAFFCSLRPTALPLHRIHSPSTQTAIHYEDQEKHST